MDIRKIGLTALAGIALSLSDWLDTGAGRTLNGHVVGWWSAIRTAAAKGYCQIKLG